MISPKSIHKSLIPLLAAIVMALPVAASSPPASTGAKAGKSQQVQADEGYRHARRLPARQRAWGYPYYGWAFYGHHYRWPSYYYGAPDVRRPVNKGAIDLNVKPKSAHVYLNGIQVGRVRHFDGWPDYLYVPEGEHELIFHKKGYESVRKKVQVVAGKVLRAELEMVKGVATPVEALSTAEQERREERRTLREQYGKDRPWPPAEGVKGGNAGVDAAAAAALTQLVLEVRPVDATIYLDGRFLGSAAQLGAEALRVAEGPHTVEIMRPGHQTRKTSFTAVPGKTLRLAISLDLEAQ